MNLEPVTKLHKRNTATSKKFGGVVMVENCDVIVFSNLWPIYSHPEARFQMHGL